MSILLLIFCVLNCKADSTVEALSIEQEYLNNHDKGFQRFYVAEMLLPEHTFKPFYIDVTVRVWITPDTDMHPDNHYACAAKDRPETGMDSIWIQGRIKKGLFVLNHATLGHELNHVLNFRNTIVIDPDQIKTIFTR